MDKVAINVFKDGSDVIVVFKNCDKSIEDIVKTICNTTAVTNIPSLAPVEEPELVKPDIEKATPVAESKPVEVAPAAPVNETAAEEPEPQAEPETTPEVAPEPVPMPEQAAEASAICPQCGNAMTLLESGIQCPECKLEITRLRCQKTLSDEELLKLVSAGETDFLDGFIGKSGKPFTAKLVLKNGKVSYQFK